MVMACQLSALLVLAIHSAVRAILFVSFNAVLGFFQTRVCWIMSPPSQETRLRNKARVTHAPSVLSIGAGLPPVPRKLVTHIQVGEFVDMAELLPDRMGITSTPSFLYSRQARMRSSLSRLKGAKSRTSCRE